MWRRTARVLIAASTRYGAASIERLCRAPRPVPTPTRWPIGVDDVAVADGEPESFRADGGRQHDRGLDLAVDGNCEHTHHERVAPLAEERHCPSIGGSDALYPSKSVVRKPGDADELTPESVVAAIRNGRVEPAVREYSLDGN
ncbi:hypothetical protein [Salinarchaeum chitinilyticum]